MGFEQVGMYLALHVDSFLEGWSLIPSKRVFASKVL